jgi:hypothetical protein
MLGGDKDIINNFKARNNIDAKVKQIEEIEQNIDNFISRDPNTPSIYGYNTSLDIAEYKNTINKNISKEEKINDKSKETAEDSIKDTKESYKKITPLNIDDFTTPFSENEQEYAIYEKAINYIKSDKSVNTKISNLVNKITKSKEDNINKYSKEIDKLKESVNKYINDKFGYVNKLDVDIMIKRHLIDNIKKVC